jgi:hypothetical protein
MYSFLARFIVSLSLLYRSLPLVRSALTSCSVSAGPNNRPATASILVSLLAALDFSRGLVYVTVILVSPFRPFVLATRAAETFSDHKALPPVQKEQGRQAPRELIWMVYARHRGPR